MFFFERGWVWVLSDCILWHSTPQGPSLILSPSSELQDQSSRSFRQVADAFADKEPFLEYPERAKNTEFLLAFAEKLLMLCQ